LEAVVLTLRHLILGAVAFLLIITLVLPAMLVKSPSTPPPTSAEDKMETIKVALYITSQDRIVHLNLEDYVMGVVCAEMPASFHQEALKAQAVVARTYVVKRMRLLGGNGCSLHPEADVCDDPSHDQGWIDPQEARRRWGFWGSLQWWPALERAVKSTEGMIITWRGTVIDPVYHSTCGGGTENSEDVWSESVAYLRGVDCHWDSHSPHLKASVTFSNAQLASLLGPGLALPATTRGTALPLEVLERSPAGRAKWVRVADSVVKGTDLRKMLGLKSTRMTLVSQEEGLTIQTIGWGHGVGMCQYGADGMAKEGKTYEEIIAHYFTGVSLVKLFRE